MKKIGGSSPPPVSTRAPQQTTAPLSSPTTTTRPTAPAPLARSGGDGFSSGAGPSSGSHVPTAAPARQPMPVQKPGGKDVTAAFAQDPKTFTANNVLNANNVMPPSNVPLPTPSAPFVPASQSTVTVNAYQRPGGNANLTMGPAGGPGIQAHYLHYVPQGAETGNPLGRFAGISGVPQHPVNTPTMIVTGPLNGCAVHAFHDKKTQTMSFVHHANFSKDGPSTLAQFQKAHPNLQLAATLEPKDYAHATGRMENAYNPPKPVETGATTFMHYDKPTRPGQQGQWSIVSQLNDYQDVPGGKDNIKDGRPPLKRPDFNAPPLQQIPIPPPRVE